PASECPHLAQQCPASRPAPLRALRLSPASSPSSSASLRTSLSHALAIPANAHTPRPSAPSCTAAAPSPYCDSALPAPREPPSRAPPSSRENPESALPL